MARGTTQTQSTQTRFRDKVMDQHDIPLLGNFYTKAEVDAMVAEAVEEARRIDEASMAKHNREATIISMILGFTALALFVDGLLRILGIIPPFMVVMLGQPHDTLLAEFEITSLPHSLHLTLIIVFKRILF